jgi:hypothetical protein
MLAPPCLLSQIAKGVTLVQANVEPNKIKTEYENRLEPDSLQAAGFDNCIGIEKVVMS